jgi:uracil-DNA glycosylase family 4
MSDLSREYLETLLEKAKEYLPSWLMEQIRTASIPASGGKSKGREYEPTLLEKMALADMKPSKLKNVSDSELREAWLRLNQWYGTAKKNKRAVEDFVNAAVYVMDEFDNRGFEYDKNLDLVKEAEKLREVQKSEGILSKLKDLPDEVVVIPNFVDIVGSVAMGKENPNDIDVLFRGDRDWDSGGRNYLIQADNVWLPIRKVLDPEKKGILHFIDSPQGSHADFIPCYSLVLRKENLKRQVVKAVLEPITHYEPTKPLMAGYTDFFSADELWKDWGSKQDCPMYISPKIDGFRTIIQKKGSKVSIWFEDSKEERADKLPSLVKALEGQPDLIIEGELVVRQGKKYVARPQVLSFLAGKIVGIPEVYLYDLLYLDKDVHTQPFSERFEMLKNLDLKGGFFILPQEEVDNQKDFLDTAKKMASWRSDIPLEGVVARRADMPYTFGATNDYAKFKFWVELKVKVLKVVKVGNGYTYDCALRSNDSRSDIPLGSTFVSKDKLANEGDTLNVHIEELILYPDGSVAWGKPYPEGPDKSRPAYIVSQAIDMAKRGHCLKEVTQKGVPSSGEGKVVFVGASPDRWEQARGKPFIGPSGETFNELYLKPLGLTRKDVFLTNAVPLYLSSDGQAREPSSEEIQEWHDWLKNELDRVNPQVVIALGQNTKQTLGELADFVLPHPALVRRIEKSEELTRKLKQIKLALSQVKKLEEVETRGNAAENFWSENWYKMFPPSGKGRFVYQHHWRGLSEEETKLDEKELLKTDHSVHGDLRFEDGDELWGFTVFLGTTEDVRKAGGDRLSSLKPNDNLQGSFKLGEPKEWLDVGIKKPYISEPGQVGATSEKYSKFFAVDYGTYEMGVWREHMFEVFLNGQKLKGRFIIEFAPVGGHRIWLIDKPTDQTPYAESHNIDDVMKELKTKKQKYLIWCKPGEKPKLNVLKIDKEIFCDIIKADNEKQIVEGIVLEPDTLDTQGDTITADEIEKAAHRFLVKSRVVGDSHKKVAGAEVVESYIVPDDIQLGNQKVKKGSWVIGVHVTDDKLWDAIKNGEYTGFSVGGFAIRE